MPYIKTYENEKFIFRNQAMKDLWDKELTGQLSDGMWENSWRGRHSEDWSYWGSLKTEVGNITKVITDRPWHFRCFTGYNSKILLDCVGDRMLKIVRETEPNATMTTVRKYNIEIAKAVREVKA